MDIQSPLQKAALTLTAIIATSVAPSPSRADVFMDWNKISACPEGTTQREEPFYHQVQKGENLWSITRQYTEGKVVQSDKNGQQVHYPTLLATANHLKPSDYIHPGQRLVVPWKKQVYGASVRRRIESY